MAKPLVKIVQDATDVVPTEVLASSIVAIAQGIRALRSGNKTLTDRALYLLIKDAAPINIGIKDIAAVFSAIDSLERLYVRKPL